MKEFVKKKAVIVMDSAGLPNYMTMFYMEPGTYEPEDVPEEASPEGSGALEAPPAFFRAAMASLACGLTMSETMICPAYAPSIAIWMIVPAVWHS